MVKNILFLAFFIVTFTVSLHAQSESKIDMIQKVEQEQQKDANISKLENYDVDAGMQSIAKNIENVKKMREEVLDRLGKNKDCYIVANEIMILENKIKSKNRFRGNADVDKNIEEMKEIIEDVKKECPEYLKFKGDK